VTIDVEGDGGGVSEKLLHYFGVSALREQEAGRRVPEVVEPNRVGTTNFIELALFLEGRGEGHWKVS
jgi:hypothetical protein